MKTIPLQLLRSTTRACFMKATRSDGQVFGFTGVDKSVRIGGVLYNIPINFSQFVLSADLNADNGELMFLPDEVVITSVDLITGVWNNFSYEIFETDWLTPLDINVITTGTTGEVSLKDDGSFSVETRGLKQALKNSQGLITQTICRNRFADFPVAFKPNIRCRLDIADYTETGTLTASANRYTATDSSRTEVSDWFGLGTFKITSAGDNQGQMRQISSYEDGVFTFTRPFFYDMAPGDTYEATAGCRGRHEITLANPDGISDCKTKFDNVLNFQGEPHTPGVDAVTRGASTGG